VCSYPAFIKVSVDNDTRLRRETARETFTLLRECYTDACVCLCFIAFCVFVSVIIVLHCICVSLFVS